MATHVFTITQDDRHHPAASTLWLQGPGSGLRSREVGCSVALAADGDSLELVGPTRAPPFGELAERNSPPRLAPAGGDSSSCHYRVRRHFRRGPFLVERGGREAFSRVPMNRSF